MHRICLDAIFQVSIYFNEKISQSSHEIVQEMRDENQSNVVNHIKKGLGKEHDEHLARDNRSVVAQKSNVEDHLNSNESQRVSSQRFVIFVTLAGEFHSFNFSLQLNNSSDERNLWVSVQENAVNYDEPAEFYRAAFEHCHKFCYAIVITQKIVDLPNEQ